MSPLERRMCRCIVAGTAFTADDVTASGSVAADPAHRPNRKQNGIGALFSTYSTQGWIKWTGAVARSTAPHRKGGMIRVWRATPAGQMVAARRLAAEPV